MVIPKCRSTLGGKSSLGFPCTCRFGQNSNPSWVIKVHCSNSPKMVRNFFLQAMLER